MRCLHAWFHKWTIWGEPEAYERANETPTAVQRRECIRCGAVAYRFVLIQRRD